jgi:hypothetical protein
MLQSSKLSNLWVYKHAVLSVTAAAAAASAAAAAAAVCCVGDMAQAAEHRRALQNAKNKFKQAYKLVAKELIMVRVSWLYSCVHLHVAMLCLWVGLHGFVL